MELIEDANRLKSIFAEIDGLRVDICSKTKQLSFEEKMKNYNRLISLRDSANQLIDSITQSLKTMDFGKVTDKKKYEKMISCIELAENPKITLEEAISLYCDVRKIENSIEDKVPKVEIINDDVLLDVLDDN